MKWPQTVPFDCPWCDYHADLSGEVCFNNTNQSGTDHRLTSLTFRLETTYHICPGDHDESAARERARLVRRANQRAYYATHRDKIRRDHRAWAAAHPNERRAYQRAYYARRRAAKAELDREITRLEST
jgi:hypothetical protein